MSDQSGSTISIMNVFEEEAIYQSFDRSESEEIFKSIDELTKPGLDENERSRIENELNSVDIKGLQALYLAPIVYKGKINDKTLELIKSKLMRLAKENKGARLYLLVVGVLENPDQKWKSEILNILLELDRFGDDFPMGIEHLLEPSSLPDISILPLLFKLKQTQGSESLNNQAFQIVKNHILQSNGLNDYVDQAFSLGLSKILAIDKFPSHLVTTLVVLFLQQLRKSPTGEIFNETENELQNFVPGIISSSSLEGIIYGCNEVISGDKSSAYKSYLRIFLARCIHAYGENQGAGYFVDLVTLLNGMSGIGTLSYRFVSNGIVSSNPKCSNTVFFQSNSDVDFIGGLNRLFVSDLINRELQEPLAIQSVFAMNKNAPGALKKVLTDWFKLLPQGLQNRANEAHDRISGTRAHRGAGGRGRDRGGRDLA